MEIAFSRKVLRQICERESVAVQHYGEPVARMLTHRLADLLSATNLTDLIAGNPTVLDGAPRWRIVVGLCDGYQMVICPNHSSTPILSSGELDRKNIVRIKILDIGNSRA